MWYVYTKDSNSHLADTQYVYVKTKKPDEGYWDGYETKAYALDRAVLIVEKIAKSTRPVQLNVQGKG